MRWIPTLVALLLLAAPSQAAPPDVPEQFAYQGVLLDGNGDPRTGTVDLTVRVFDALAGGTLLYVQSFAPVPLTDGVFTLQLGPLGEASDVPVDPLTTSLADALAGDLAATGPSRFLDLTVGTEGPLPRTQLLAVPYALHAESADVATDAGSVNGLSSEVVTQIYSNFNFDGGGPPNDDPLEGLLDSDGDGIANFLDPDNDGDAFSDETEVFNGTGLNLPTPSLGSLSGFPRLWSAAGSATLTGSSFEPGMLVEVDDVPVATSNVTPTSADLSLGLAPLPGPTVRVVRLNGETGTESFTSSADGSHILTVAVHRTQITVDVAGTQQLLIGGGDLGSDRVQADSDGDGDFDVWWAPESGLGEVAVAWSPATEVSQIRCDPLGGDTCEVLFGVDTNADFSIGSSEEIAVGLPPGVTSGIGLFAAAIAFDSSGNPVLGYELLANPQSVAVVAHDRDGNGDFAGPAELVTVDTLPGAGLRMFGELALDAADRVAYFYYDFAGQLRLAYDRSGDGDFDDIVSGTAEVSTVPTTATAEYPCLGVAFDAGVMTVVYESGSGPILARDLNGDGDVVDAGEDTALAGTPALGCDVESHPGEGLVVAHDSDGLVILVDRNADGDFDDADEAIQATLPAFGPDHPVALARDVNGRAFLATRSSIFIDPGP